MVDWKKEIKFGGSKPKQQDATAPAAVDGVVQPERTSIWKKELSFGRKPQPTNELDDDTPVIEPSPPLEPDPPAAVELIQSYLPEPAAAEPLELVPDPVEQVFPVAVPDPEPAPAVQFLDFLEPTIPEPVASEALQVAEAPAPAVPMPVAAPVAEAVVVHPPVPEAQLPPLPDEPEPKAKKSKKKKEKKEKQVEDYDETARVPFYKRKLSLGRKPKDAPASDSEQATEPKPKRKGLSFSIPRPGPRSSRPGKLPKRVVGLKIGASQLAAATVSNNGHAEVLQLAREALDPGIVSNGELREPDLLADAL
jgi:hypothetical protein